MSHFNNSDIKNRIHSLITCLEAWEGMEFTPCRRGILAGSSKSATNLSDSDWDMYIVLTSNMNVRFCRQRNGFYRMRLKHQHPRCVSSTDVLHCVLQVALSMAPSWHPKVTSPSITMKRWGISIDVLPAFRAKGGVLIPYDENPELWRFVDYRTKIMQEQALSRITGGRWRTVARLLKIANQNRGWQLSSFALQCLSFYIHLGAFFRQERPDVKQGFIDCLSWLSSDADEGLPHPWDDTQGSILFPLTPHIRSNVATLLRIVECGTDEDLHFFLRA